VERLASGRPFACFSSFSVGLRYLGKLRFRAVWLNGEQNKKITFLKTLVLVTLADARWVAFPWLLSRMGKCSPRYSRWERGQSPSAFLLLSFCPYQLKSHLWCLTKSWCALRWVLYILKLSALPLTLGACIPWKSNFWSIILLIKYLKPLYVLFTLEKDEKYKSPSLLTWTGISYSHSGYANKFAVSQPFDDKI